MDVQKPKEFRSPHDPHGLDEPLVTPSAVENPIFAKVTQSYDVHAYADSVTGNRFYETNNTSPAYVFEESLRVKLPV